MESDTQGSSGEGFPEQSKKNKGVWILVGLALVGGYWWWPSESEESERNLEIDTVEASLPPAPKETVVKHVVAEGDIPAEVFMEHGKWDANDMAALLTATEDVYDFTKIRIGRELQFVFREGEQAALVRYHANTEEMIVAERQDGAFTVRKQAIPYVVTERTRRVVIDEFLYKDGLDAGLSPASILEVADIFSFDIDFTTEIREGDEMVIIYEERTLDGVPATDGRILAATFTNVGQPYFAYYFEADGEGSHYDGDGNELVRQFLRAPLSYRKITSGYTGARMHPITKTVTAHYQIDYAAPTGTPVVATARGTVVSARFERGWGHIVRLRHENGYTTHYGHLSAYATGVKAGASVVQGQVVGYVGSTGWSTGPHLDYGMKLDGNPVNPLSLELPKGKPLQGEQRDAFQAMKQQYDERLEDPSL